MVVNPLSPPSPAPQSLSPIAGQKRIIPAPESLRPLPKTIARSPARPSRPTSAPRGSAAPKLRASPKRKLALASPKSKAAAKTRAVPPASAAAAVSPDGVCDENERLHRLHFDRAFSASRQFHIPHGSILQRAGEPTGVWAQDFADKKQLRELKAGVNNPLSDIDDPQVEIQRLETAIKRRKVKALDTVYNSKEMRSVDDPKPSVFGTDKAKGKVFGAPGAWKNLARNPQSGSGGGSEAKIVGASAKKPKTADVDPFRFEPSTPNPYNKRSAGDSNGGSPGVMTRSKRRKMLEIQAVLASAAGGADADGDAQMKELD
jgi:hypothetical protein